MNELDEKRAKYPRVSSIIGKQNEAEMRSIPVETLANACIRGTKVHAYCTALVKGMFLPDVELEYQPYIDAFSLWADSNVINPIECSKRLYDDVKCFTGEFDLIVQMKNGKKALIDIKTSSAVSKAWPIQLAAYDHLCKLNGILYDEVFVLHLRKKSKKRDDEENAIQPVKAVTYTYEDLASSWDIFSSALTCYNYFHKKDKE